MKLKIVTQTEANDVVVEITWWLGRKGKMQSRQHIAITLKEQFELTLKQNAPFKKTIGRKGIAYVTKTGIKQVLWNIRGQKPAMKLKMRVFDFVPSWILGVEQVVRVLWVITLCQLILLIILNIIGRPDFIFKRSSQLTIWTFHPRFCLKHVWSLVSLKGAEDQERTKVVVTRRQSTATHSR